MQMFTITLKHKISNTQPVSSVCGSPINHVGSFVIFFNDFMAQPSGVGGMKQNENNQI